MSSSEEQNGGLKPTERALANEIHTTLNTMFCTTQIGLHIF